MQCCGLRGGGTVHRVYKFPFSVSAWPRRTRSHRLIVRGAVFESIVPEAKTMTDEEAADLLRLALTGEEARAYLKKRAEDGNAG